MTDYAYLLAELYELRNENRELKNTIGELEEQLRGKDVSREEFRKAQEGMKEAAKNFAEVLEYLKGEQKGL